MSMQIIPILVQSSNQIKFSKEPGHLVKACDINQTSPGFCILHQWKPLCTGTKPITRALGGLSQTTRAAGNSLSIQASFLTVISLCTALEQQPHFAYFPISALHLNTSCVSVCRSLVVILLLLLLLHSWPYHISRAARSWMLLQAFC
jgi:hypothetical protein